MKVSQHRFFAISGISLDVDSIDLGNGVVLRRTYAHLMTHPIIAFAPAERGKAHPGPWKAPVTFFDSTAGWGCDVVTELAIPSTLIKPDMSAVDIVAWIALLMSLRLDNAVNIVFSSQVPIHLAASDDSKIKLFADSRLPPFIKVSPAQLEWLIANWYESIELRNDEDLQFAFEALYSSHTIANELRLVLVWATLENLFCSKNAELRFRVSAIIASFLEPHGDERLVLFKSILKLYDDRSAAAHGGQIKNNRAYEQSLSLARRAMSKVIEQRRLPSESELEKLMF